MAKCPKCGNPRIRYLVKRSQKKEPRTDFKVKCSKCGYKGTMPYKNTPIEEKEE